MERAAETEPDALADVTDEELARAVEDLLAAGALMLAPCPCCGAWTLVRRPEDLS